MCVASSYWDMARVVTINGYWGLKIIKCCIVTVYAPSQAKEKEELWECLTHIVNQFGDYCLCLAGDFNSVRVTSERVGKNGSTNRREITLFNNFIQDVNLHDLQIHGRSFTCYTPDEKCKSRIDRILVNNNWLSKWSSASLKVLQCTVSDHCPLYFGTKTMDWGPRPFQFVNAWCYHLNFSSFIEESWKKYNVSRWGSYVVKEKLKCLKNDLNKWNGEIFGSIDTK